MSDEAKAPEQGAQEGHSTTLDRLTTRVHEKADEAGATLTISACRKLIDIIEARQLDLAMVSIEDQFDPQNTLMDKGRFEALSELATDFRGMIDEKRKEGEAA